MAVRNNKSQKIKYLWDFLNLIFSKGRRCSTKGWLGCHSHGTMAQCSQSKSDLAQTVM